MRDRNFEESQKSGECARVQVVIEQEFQMVRNGFLATLNVENSLETDELENITAVISFHDAQTQQDISDLFFLSEQEVAGSIVNHPSTGLTLAAGTKGSLSWTIIPATDVAPESSRRVAVSGYFFYSKDGNRLPNRLFPVEITVFPDPQLEINYFHSFKVHGDDPFTEAVEPSLPFFLGCLVSNVGYGDAREMKIITGQPEIVENEKGLLVDFAIIDVDLYTPPSQVQGGDPELWESTLGQFRHSHLPQWCGPCRRHSRANFATSQLLGSTQVRSKVCRISGSIFSRRSPRMG